MSNEKKNYFLGETLDTEEKLEEAYKEIEKILDEYPTGVTFKEALYRFFQERDLYSSDKTALHLYSIEKLFPDGYEIDKEKNTFLKKLELRRSIWDEFDRDQEQQLKGKPVIEHEALMGWYKNIVSEWERLTTDRFPTAKEIDDLNYKAHEYLKKYLKVRLCAIPECLKQVKGRHNKKYCSESCRLKAKQRRYRRK